jgi:hypothetical protein
MKRRDLLQFGPYSVLIFADQLGAAPQQQTNPTDRIRKEMDRLAPKPGADRHVAPAEPHMALVDLQTDILVAGGGLAGVCAAISAARSGAKVILLNDRSRLGGNSSSEVKMHVVGASAHKGRPGWRESGLLEEIRLEDAVNNPHRSWELWDLLLYDKVVSEPNITLLLDTVLYSAETKDATIRQVMARCDKSEHLYRIKAKIFIDATGDSRLALEAGAEIRIGRESRSEFNESLAVEKGDDKTLGSSILFTSRLYPRAVPFKAPSWARKVTAETLKFRKITSWEYGYWWVEWGGSNDIIADNERIRFELLSIVMGVWDYIKNSGDHPTSDRWGMDWVGMMPGKRGSRRVVGDYMVTQNDLVKGGQFADAVAIGGWPLDDHNGMDFDHSDVPPFTSIKLDLPYNLPLRALCSKSIRNLMMAGRNISCSHVAFTSTRVMGTCAVVGQAAGTAAAMALEHGVAPSKIPAQPAMLTKLQQRLLRNDQSIIRARNEDPADLARKARVVASGADGAYKPERLLSGETRDIPKGEVHHWAAPLVPADGGAWIELQWDKPQRISEVQVTFHSGFERELTLTSSDTVNRGIIRGPQPETVKDYQLVANGKPVAEVSGNYQRVRRHRISFEADKLRLHVKSTNGDELARVFEIRCYA